MVQPLLAVNFQGLQNCHNPGSTWQQDTDLVGRLQRIGEILDVELDTEPRVELAGP